MISSSKAEPETAGKTGTAPKIRFDDMQPKIEQKQEIPEAKETDKKKEEEAALNDDSMVFSERKNLDDYIIGK